MFIAIDTYSKWLDVFEIKTTSTKVGVEKLDESFARYETPYTLISDNPASFLHQNRLRIFVATNNIQNITRVRFSPYSNGQAERYGRITKSGFKKLLGNRNNFAPTYF